jgi:hypothetical protein
MKMRIKGNSLRLRVSRSELSWFANGGCVEDSIQLGPQPWAKLTYALEPDARAKEIRTKYLDGLVVVQIPLDMASEWERSDMVGLAGTMDLGSAGSLHILVEKDFACLDKSDADNEDTFSNPNMAAC